MADAREALAALEGVALTYSDQTGTERAAPGETAAAVLAAMGYESAGGFRRALAEERSRRDARRLPEYHVVAEDRAPGLAPEADWSLTDEDGGVIEGRGALPPLPLGRHRLEVEDETCWLLSAPPELPLPPRGWGVVLPL